MDNSNLETKKIVMSGMRPTGQLHIGHYHGVLKNWLQLQQTYKCYFAVADWHALTTHYEDQHFIQEQSLNMVIDWLACGVDHTKAVIFTQSNILEHAELHLLLSMLTPVSWLQRIPSYKEQQQKLHTKNLATYGFLGYPLLQSADILAYQTDLVPVGADQIAHIEITRKIARRFNWLYGKDRTKKQQVLDILSKLPAENGHQYHILTREYGENPDQAGLDKIKNFLAQQDKLSRKNKDLLIRSILEPYASILAEPATLLAENSKITGLDGQKMSKSYANTISLRATNDEINKKILMMPTDPARIRRNDPGTPEKCPVWSLHLIYSDKKSQQEISDGCTQATIGCVDCKRRLVDSFIIQHAPIRDKITILSEDKAQINTILRCGNNQARAAASSTLVKVRRAMGLN